MAITDWWLGEATEATASVVVRSDALETLTLSCNGATYVKTADPSVDDGLVRFDITGLKAGRQYSFSMGGTSGAVKTMPSRAPFSIAWFSCTEANHVTTAGYRIVRDGAVACFSIGDTPYTNGLGSNSAFGVSTVGTDADQTLANFYAHHLRQRRNFGFHYMGQHLPIYMMIDDHEWPGDDWDHSLTKANDLTTIANTQADVDVIFDTGNRARIAYHKGNPTHIDGALAEKPPSADPATPTANYPPMYYRLRIGLAEFFVLDCISHRSPASAVDDATKTMLGSQQKQWLKNRLSASTATFKVIVSPKKTMPKGSNENLDSWAVYTTERDEIFNYIRDNNITSAIWLTGDTHTPMVNFASTANGDSWDMLDVCACPVGVEQTAPGSTGPYELRQFTDAGQVYGLLTVTDDYIEAQLRRIVTGAPIWTGRVYAGSNALSYPETRFAVV